MSDSSSAKQSSNSIKAFLGGFMGWTFDAFDFFIVTYVLARLSKDFNRPIADIALLLTASLVARPIGAILFGLLGDRFGRRRPLMLNVLFNSGIEILSGLASSYHALLLLRLLFGIGMGGVWGLGASLAMESAPADKRGKFSGILQEGYAIGNLLAAVAFWTVFPRWGWRPMFFLSIVPALLTVLLLSRVEESTAWKAAVAKKKDWGTYFRTIAGCWKRMLYLGVLMSTMGYLSHGTQDLYPTFLLQQLHLSGRLTAAIGVLAMIGAIIGGTIGGIFSDRYGRRRTMIIAQIFAILIIPLWVLSHQIALIATGAFLMQFMVQASWGVIPAYINELIPDNVRALLPGFAYQFGILVASTAPYFEARATRVMTYGQAMGIVVGVVVFIGIIIIALGPEARDVKFGQQT